MSALENALVTPSLKALEFFAERLGTTAAALLMPDATAMTAASVAPTDWQSAADVYLELATVSLGDDERAHALMALAHALTHLDEPKLAVRYASEAVTIFDALGAAADGLSARSALTVAEGLMERAAGARTAAPVRSGAVTAPGRRHRPSGRER